MSPPGPCKAKGPATGDAHSTYFVTKLLVGPFLKLERGSILGEVEGVFFITLTCSSLSQPLRNFSSLCGIHNLVCSASLELPAIPFFIFIFLGSFLPSVQSNRSSNTFIPVISVVSPSKLGVKET